MLHFEKRALSMWLVMGLTLLSRVFGFLRIVVVGAIFGGRGEADVLNAVFSLPNNLRIILAEGSFTSAVIPELSQTLMADEGKAQARLLVRNLLSLQLLLIVPLLFLCQLYPSEILGVFLAFESQEKRDLACSLFRWMVNFMLFMSISATLMAVENVHKEFFAPGVAPLLFSLTTIIIVLLAHEKYGPQAFSFGVLLGGALQVMLLYPVVHRRGYALWPAFSFGQRAFRRLFKKWWPILLTSLIFLINQYVVLLLASGLKDGSVSALLNATLFAKLPYGLFYASIATVLFPQMSRQVGRGEFDKAMAVLMKGLSALFALLLPAALFLTILNKPIIVLALQRGAFSPSDSALTALTLIPLSWEILPVALYAFTQRFFYSTNRTSLPLFSAVLTLFFTVSLSLWLRKTVLGVAGLPVAGGIASLIGFLVLCLRLPFTASVWREERKLFLISVGKVLLILLMTTPLLLLVRHMIGIFGVYSGWAWFLFFGGALFFSLLVVGLYLAWQVEFLLIRRR